MPGCRTMDRRLIVSVNPFMPGMSWNQNMFDHFENTKGIFSPVKIANQVTGKFFWLQIAEMHHCQPYNITTKTPVPSCHMKILQKTRVSAPLSAACSSFVSFCGCTAFEPHFRSFLCLFRDMQCIETKKLCSARNRSVSRFCERLVKNQ